MKTAVSFAAVFFYCHFHSGINSSINLTGPMSPGVSMFQLTKILLALFGFISSTHLICCDVEFC